MAKRSHKGVERAFRDLLVALGVNGRAELRDTPKRAAALWVDKLAAGEGADLGRLLGEGTPHAQETLVNVTDIGVHLVCPHHLTVAFGKAHVAYAPRGRIVGFGAVSRLVEACCARLVLQEDATQSIVDALLEHLDAKAAVAVIHAVHPCHNLLQPRSHESTALTWAVGGHKQTRQLLETRLQLAIGAAK